MTFSFRKSPNFSVSTGFFCVYGWQSVLVPPEKVVVVDVQGICRLSLIFHMNDKGS